MALRRWTADEDASAIVKFYNQLSQRPSDLAGEQLVDSIEWRVYTEWCCNRDESSGTPHWFYKGEALDNWLRDETHYALERKGFDWHAEEGRFNVNANFPEIYRETRDAVLNAAVIRAVEFFKDCEKYVWPPEGDARNLRASLEPYL